MKKLLFICTALLIFSSMSYAEDQSFKKLKDWYNGFWQNEKVVAANTRIKAEWASFKKWFNNLPLIKDYNESIYSGENYKKVMNEMGSEYKPHLSNDGASADMLKRGKDYWKKLD